MRNVQSIITWLSQFPLRNDEKSVPSSGLLEIHRKLFHHKSNVPKAVVLSDLANFYADKRNVQEIWNGSKNGPVANPGLTDVEKAFILPLFQYDGVEYRPATKLLCNEYGLKFPMPQNRLLHWYSGSEDPFDPNCMLFTLPVLHLLKHYYPQSNVEVLFPGGKYLPPFVLEALRPVITTAALHYDAVQPKEGSIVIDREERIGDYAALVQYIAQEPVKTLRGGYEPSKPKLVQICAALGLEDAIDGFGRFITPKETARSIDFMVSFPMFALACNSGWIQPGDGTPCTPGKNALFTLKATPDALAKKLFRDYIASEKIKESDFIRSITLRPRDLTLDWNQVRSVIVHMLKGCPVGQWISYEQFERHLLIYAGNFFSCEYNRALRKAYVSLYTINETTAYWDTCERPVVRLILSFLCAIGMLEIAYREYSPEAAIDVESEGLLIDCFRITQLGAYLLEMPNTYAPIRKGTPADETADLIVQPDHTITLIGAAAKIAHEPYLAQFMTRESTDNHLSVYRLDFPSIVRAFNHSPRIEPKDVCTYLEEHAANGLPDNVRRSLSDWQEKIGRLRIRTVTILESDDPFLIQELAHLKGIEKYSDGVLTNAMRINDKKDIASLKKLIEKNGWLVLDGAGK